MQYLITNWQTARQLLYETLTTITLDINRSSAFPMHYRKPQME